MPRQWRLPNWCRNSILSKWHDHTVHLKTPRNSFGNERMIHCEIGVLDFVYAVFLSVLLRIPKSLARVWLKVTMSLLCMIRFAPALTHAISKSMSPEK